MGLVVLLLVLVAAGEFGARWYLGDRVEREASSRLGAPVDASFGRESVLWGVVTDRSVPTVHLTSPGAGDVPRLDVTGHHARLDDGAVTVDSAEGTAFVTDAQLTRAVEGQTIGANPVTGGVSIRSVHADPGAGVLRADIGGLAEVGAEPGVSGGRLTLSPQQAEILGFPLPDGLFGGITTTVDTALEKLPEGVSLDGAKVVPGGLEVHLTGTAVRF